MGISERLTMVLVKLVVPLVAIAFVAFATDVSSLDDGPTAGKVLGEGFGFGSNALVTSGSFTLFVATFKEKVLGEVQKAANAPSSTNAARCDPAAVTLSSTELISESESGGEMKRHRRRRTTTATTAPTTGAPTTGAPTIGAPANEPANAAEPADCANHGQQGNQVYNFQCACRKPRIDSCALENGIGNEVACRRPHADPKTDNFGPGWDGDPQCPDTISSQGVFLEGFNGGICAKWDSSRVISGSQACTIVYENNDPKKRPIQRVCTVAKVIHGDTMSRSAGLLAMKRVNCKWSGGNWECATFKSGLCIDVGQEVWTHYWNDWIGSDYNANAKSFASAAVDIMKQHESQGKPALDEQYRCKDFAYTNSCPNRDACNSAAHGPDPGPAGFWMKKDGKPWSGWDGTPQWRLPTWSVSASKPTDTQCCAYEGHKYVDSCSKAYATRMTQNDALSGTTWGCATDNRNVERGSMDKTISEELVLML